MKKTVVLDETLERLIQSMRGKLISAWKEDVGFSSMLNFLILQGFFRFSELDDSMAAKHLKAFRLSKDKMSLEEDVASLWDKVRERVEAGEVVISQKESS